jgi:hypothetical protein
MDKTIEKHKKEMLRLQERNNILKEKNSIVRRFTGEDS